uniref:Putative ovule protein n=1 Tax=Solanum chacoense TaxID=4108 RepID=A0A0V0IH79_SOLCH
MNSIWILWSSSAYMVLCCSSMRVITTIIDQQVDIFDAKSFACTNRYHSLSLTPLLAPMVNYLQSLVIIQNVFL